MSEPEHEEDDIAPGAGYPDPDPDFDYDGQMPETTFGQVKEGEISITTTNGNRVRFKVSEPDPDGGDDPLHVIRQQATGFVNAQREVCEYFVDKPELTDAIWSSMKPDERMQLEDECLDWFNVDRLIGEDVMRETLEEMDANGVLSSE